MLTVRIDHLASAGGCLRMALYNEHTFPDDSAPSVTDKEATATAPSVTASFAPVPPGIYAVKMFQDENCNNKFDFWFFGIPKERYGFSNNAPPDYFHLAPPRFEDAKITLKPGENNIEVWLR